MRSVELLEEMQYIETLTPTELGDKKDEILALIGSVDQLYTRYHKLDKHGNFRLNTRKSVTDGQLEIVYQLKGIADRLFENLNSIQKYVEIDVHRESSEYNINEIDLASYF